MMAYDLADPVCDHRGCDQTGEGEPHRINPPADIETGDFGQALVEWRHRVPKIRLGATDAGMTAADRPIGAFVPLDHRTILRCRRAFAPHLVEAMALAVRFVAPRFHILSGVEMRAPLAIVVDGLAVSEERAP